MDISTLTTLRNLTRAASVGTVFVTTLGLGLASAQVDVSGENFLTGANSLNVNRHRISDSSTFRLRNDADIDNEVDANVRTGGNRILDNTTVEDVSTGFVDIGGSFVNDLNLASFDLGGSDDGLRVEAEFSNDTTGSQSENRNTLEIRNNSSIDIDNDADIDNDVDIRTNTGDNTVSRNTTVGDVSTGDTRIRVALDTVANGGTADLDLSGLGGSTEVTTDLSNRLTGFNSENINQVTVNNSRRVTIDNETDIDNDFNVTANTGNNNVNRNTTVGDVSTGDVLVTLTARNIAN